MLMLCWFFVDVELRNKASLWSSEKVYDKQKTTKWTPEDRAISAAKTDVHADADAARRTLNS